ERVAPNLRDGGGTGLRHNGLQFAAQNGDHRFDALLPKRRQAPNVGTPDPDGGRAERQRFENVRAATEPTVDEHWNFPCGARQNFRQAFNRPAAARVFVAAVIRHNDAVDPVLYGQRRILAGHDAFQDDLHACHIAHTLHIVPVELQAGLSLERSNRAEHIHRRVWADAGDLGKSGVTTNAAFVRFAVEVADADALDRFRADRVGPAVIDRPNQHGAPG